MIINDDIQNIYTLYNKKMYRIYIHCTIIKCLLYDMERNEMYLGKYIFQYNGDNKMS